MNGNLIRLRANPLILAVRSLRRPALKQDWG